MIGNVVIHELLELIGVLVLVFVRSEMQIFNHNNYNYTAGDRTESLFYSVTSAAWVKGQAERVA